MAWMTPLQAQIVVGLGYGAMLVIGMWMGLTISGWDRARVKLSKRTTVRRHVDRDEADRSAVGVSPGPVARHRFENLEQETRNCTSEDLEDTDPYVVRPARDVARDAIEGRRRAVHVQEHRDLTGNWWERDPSKLDGEPEYWRPLSPYRPQPLYPS